MNSANVVSNAVRVAVVSGGSSGIGKALVIRLAGDGWTVYTCARDASRLQALSRELPGVNAVVCDVTDRTAVRAFAQQVREAAPGVLLLVSNAGGSREIDFTSPGLDELDLTADLRANTEGAVNLIAEFMPVVRRAKAGRDPDREFGICAGTRHSGAAVFGGEGGAPQLVQVVASATRPAGCHGDRTVAAGGGHAFGRASRCAEASRRSGGAAGAARSSPGKTGSPARRRALPAVSPAPVAFAGRARRGEHLTGCSPRQRVRTGNRRQSIRRRRSSSGLRVASASRTSSRSRPVVPEPKRPPSELPLPPRPPAPSSPLPVAVGQTKAL